MINFRKLRFSSKSAILLGLTTFLVMFIFSIAIPLSVIGASCVYLFVVVVNMTPPDLITLVQSYSPAEGYLVLQGATPDQKFNNLLKLFQTIDIIAFFNMNLKISNSTQKAEIISVLFDDNLS